MNRRSFQELARLRLREAQTLLKSKQWEGAYYLAGYAIECALKACIAKKTRRSDFPPRPDQIREIYVHDPSKLVKAAGLLEDLASKQEIDPEFKAKWNVVKDWSEDARYNEKSEKQASDLIRAIQDPTHGVLRWLRGHW
jgi:HEPN domain-containing protein